MSTELERDLGLPAVIAISMGAMIGSGIFILPGLAMEEAGPAVILAFLIAGALVFPAALSMAEMGTAMPEAGGTYVFIERGMGPAVGTVAGIGTWFALQFKGALALVGGIPYLALLIGVPETTTALVLAVLLIGINIIGVKQTGQTQVVMVIVMVLVLAGFVATGLPTVDSASYEPFLAEGVDGLAAATGLVIVSFAGVTKVASVAEEIEDPGRNLPLGLLLTLGVTTLLYVLIVFVVVGAVSAEELSGTLTPMAVAVEPILGGVGVVAIVLAAMLALVSTANAGLLTSSRYPLAMARDNLAPPQLGDISDRFSTPVTAIGFTGAVMLVIIAFVPIREIAELASAFQMLVYVIVNVALIAFREGSIEWYDPDFASPGYPWLQLVGIVGGIGIITQMGPIPIVGSVGIIVAGAIWYWAYGRRHADREGVAVELARRSAGQRVVTDTRETLETSAPYQVLIAIRRDVSREEENALLRTAAPLVRKRGGRIRVIRFDEVPDQVPLDQAATSQSADPSDFERRTDELAEELGVRIETGEIVSHDTKHAVVNAAERMGTDLVLTRRDPMSRLNTLLGRDADWIMEHAPCDVVFVQTEELETVEEISVVTDRSPFNDPLKVELADAIATEAGATIRFLYAVSESAPDSLIETIEDYHRDLDELCSVPVESTIIETDDPVGSLSEAMATADVIMLSTVTHRRIPNVLFEPRSDRLAAALDRSVLLVHSQRSRRTTFLEPIIDRVLFRR